MINIFGHVGMTKTSELDRIGNRLFNNNKSGGRFLGAFPQDKLPQQMYNYKDSNFAIVNVDTTGMPGTHWVGIAGIPNSNKIMVFDSFGRATKNLLPVIAGSGKTIDTEYDAEQRVIQDSCGQFSMAWLDFFKKYGHKAAKLI